MREKLKAEFTLQTKQMLRLIVSPQMQKALSLLQLPVLELEAAVAAELEENPLLEYSEAEKKVDDQSLFSSVDEKFFSKKRREENDLQSFVENTLASQTSLFEALMGQAREKFPEKESLHLAKLVIGNLDENGFLQMALEEIAALEEIRCDKLEEVLEEIKQFDPPGVGARDIQESLLLQLKRKGKEKGLAYQIVKEAFAEMQTNRLPLLAKKSGTTVDVIRQVIEEEIATLAFHPGRLYARGHYAGFSEAIVPDVMISEDLAVEINERSLPPVRFNSHYLNLLTSESLPHETRDYIEEKISSGKWLMRNLCERQKTLYKIAVKICEKQQMFFRLPEGNLVSLTMRQIAEELDLHESTIARAVANKYLSCARGLFPLRFFFTHAYVTTSGEELSAPAVKDLLKKIISEENSLTPYSDEELSSRMLEKGVPCARRTIAKYRAELGLGSRSERKRYN